MNRADVDCVCVHVRVLHTLTVIRQHSVSGKGMDWSLKGKNTETGPIKTCEPHGFCLESQEASC